VKSTQSSVLSTQSLSMTPEVTANLAAGRPRLRGWLLMSPLLVWLGLFVIAPTAVMLVYSFCERDELGQVVFQFNLKNYKRIFVPEYGGILIKSVGVGLLAAALAIVGLILYRKFDLHDWVFHRVLWWAVDLLTTAVLTCWITISVFSGGGRLVSAIVRSFVYSLLATLATVFLARLIVYLLDLYARQRPRLLVMILTMAATYIAMRQNVFGLTRSGNYLRILLNSIELAALATVLCTLIGYPVAYFIGKASDSTRNKLLMLVMIPFWTNFLIRTYAWITILKNEGLLNNFLKWAEVIHEPLDIFATPTAVLIGTVYAYLPFMILPIYGSVEKLDNALIDAAMDLGANPVRAFANVIVPLTRPGIVAGILLVFVPAVGMFAINDILGGKKVPLIGNVIDAQFKTARNAPFGSALGIILLLLFAAAFFLSLKRQKAS
jgi:spermidine/putrescine transport system permease protein